MRALRVRVLSRQRAEPLLYGGFAVYAAVYAAVTDLAPHRMWALCAAVGYALAAALALARVPRAAVVVLVLGTLLVPLGWEAVAHVANPEVAILRVAAQRWLASGTPFPGPAELAAAGGDVDAYNVYLPGLALFGMPSAVFGASVLTDPRWFLTLAGCGLFWWLGPRRLTVPFLCCPFVALELATGATDIAVVALLCLGVASTGRRAGVSAGASAGVFVGLAAACKALAWPAVVVLAVTQWRARRWWGVPVALGVAAVFLVPVALADPVAFRTNVVDLPLGRLPVRLTAGSPLPGHLLAAAGLPGVATAALALAALVLGVAMLRRPPRDPVTAARWLAAGLTAAILLAPASRFGYLVYPVALLLLPLLRRQPPPAPPLTSPSPSLSSSPSAAPDGGRPDRPADSAGHA